MYTLELRHHFDSAHKLENYEGKCRNLHGHRWEVVVRIQTHELRNDMVADFSDIKAIINEFDHTYLNDKVDFNPTAENIAEYLQHMLKKLPGDNEKKIRVTVWESPEGSVEYED